MQGKEISLGNDWFWSLQMENLGRNMATAGGLTLAFKRGMRYRDLTDAPSVTVPSGRMPQRLARGTRELEPQRMTVIEDQTITSFDELWKGL